MPPLIGIDAVEALIKLIEGDRGKWPKARETKVLTGINTWRALYDGDRDALKRAANWRHRHREYRVDALPERIADAWAHFLFGEDPQVKAADENDQDRLDEVLGTNFASELERAASLNVSEGEIWARIYVDETVADRPLLDWVSRANVLPLWSGPILSAAALVTVLDDPDGDKAVVWRHFEIHAQGIVYNALYKGKDAEVGTRMELVEHPATAELLEAWSHGLPYMLVFRVPNRLRRDRRIGVSDYARILDTLLDLNESGAIGAANMRLSALKRAVVDSSYLTPSTRFTGDLAPEEAGPGAPHRANEPRFDAGEQVFVRQSLDEELGTSGDAPLSVLDYGFDAAPLIAWRRELVDTALSRVGLTGQYVGVGEASGVGYAISGTALRLRLIPTASTGKGKGRYWDDELPKIIRALAAVDHLPAAQGGLGHEWADVEELPVVERRQGLPEDELEEATKHQTLVQAGLESIETGVRALHPDWDDDMVTAEVDRIREDKAAAAPSTPFGI